MIPATFGNFVVIIQIGQMNHHKRHIKDVQL